MLNIISDVLTKGSKLLEDEVRFIRTHLQQLGVTWAILAALAIAGGLSIAGFAAGITLLLAPLLGIGAALLLVSAVLFAVSVVAGMIVHRRNKPGVADTDSTSEQKRGVETSVSTSDPSNRLDQSADQLCNPSSTPAAVGDEQSFSTPGVEKVYRTVTSHPAEIGSALFAAVCLLGARRSMRVAFRAGRIASTIGAASKVASSLASQQESVSSHPHPSDFVDSPSPS